MSSATCGLKVFTLGCSDNGWKRIPGPFVPMNDLPFKVLFFFNWTDPVSVERQVLYWFVESNRFISMNVLGKHNYDLVETGGKLALLLKV